MISLPYLLLLICFHGAIASDIDNDSTNVPFDSNTVPSHTKFATVKENSNSSGFEIKKHRSLTKWKPFSDHDELVNQVNAYCQDPENYDTKEYGPIEQWDTSQVTSMQYMFHRKSSCNPDISKWDVSKVSNFYGMFDQAKSFNQAIGDWDVSKGTIFNGMFWGASSFNRDIGKWNVSSGQNFRFMFRYANSFNQAIGDWDVSSGNNFRYMFSVARSFNQAIGDWDVSKGRQFGFMFSYAGSFNQAIGDWDVSKGTDFDNMLRGARSFNQNLKSWLPWIHKLGTNSRDWCLDAICVTSMQPSTSVSPSSFTRAPSPPTPVPTPAISCDGKNKVQCKKLKEFCVFGKNKIPGKCQPKKSKYKKDCGQFDAEDTCDNDSGGNCMWDGECTHKCDGLVKKDCKKVKNSDDTKKMCKVKMLSNPCKGCQSKTTCD